MVFVKTGEQPTIYQLNYYNNLRKEMGYNELPIELLKRTHTMGELGAAIGDMKDRIEERDREKEMKLARYKRLK